jgi:hypothetical protein
LTRLDLLHYMHDTTKESGFFKVCMTLTHDLLLLMVVVAKHTLQTDDAKHRCLPSLSESISISHYWAYSGVMEKIRSCGFGTLGLMF